MPYILNIFTQSVMFQEQRKIIGICKKIKTCGKQPYRTCTMPHGKRINCWNRGNTEKE